MRWLAAATPLCGLPVTGRGQGGAWVEHGQRIWYSKGWWRAGCGAYQPVSACHSGLQGALAADTGAVSRGVAPQVSDFADNDVQDSFVGLVGRYPVFIKDAAPNDTFGFLEGVQRCQLFLVSCIRVSPEINNTS